MNEATFITAYESEPGKLFLEKMREIIEISYLKFTPDTLNEPYPPFGSWVSEGFNYEKFISIVSSYHGDVSWIVEKDQHRENSYHIFPKKLTEIMASEDLNSIKAAQKWVGNNEPDFGVLAGNDFKYLLKFINENYAKKV
jgi:hypothetical protein